MFIYHFENSRVFKNYAKLGFPGGSVAGNPQPMQETQVQSLVQEDPTCQGATKYAHHNYWAYGLQSRSCDYWIHHIPQLLKPMHPRVCAQQQEKPPWWGAHTPQLEGIPISPELEKSPHSNEDPGWSKIKINKCKLQKIALQVKKKN